MHQFVLDVILQFDSLVYRKINFDFGFQNHTEDLIFRIAYTRFSFTRR